MYLFEKLTALLPKGLQPYAKSVYPLIATVIGTAGTWAATGEFDDEAIRTAVVGLVATLLAYGPPNRPREPEFIPPPSQIG